MVSYINDLIGEMIFPVYLYVEEDGIDESYMSFIERKANKMIFDSFYSTKTIGKNELSQKVSWIFRTKNNEQVIVNKKDGDKQKPKYMVRALENGLCALDYETAKLHVWNSKVCTSATFGAKRLMKKKNDDNQAVGTRIYLKGIYVCQDHHERDSELLESLDIKGFLKKEYINLNRNEFTESGKKFLEDIYEEVMESFKEALEIFAHSTEKADSVEQISKKLVRRVQQYEEKNDEEWYELNEALLSAVCMSFFVRLRKQTYANICCENRDNKCQWQDLLENLSKDLLESEKFNKHFEKGFFKKIPVYYEDEMLKKQKNEKKMMVFSQLLQCENKVAIVSDREGKHSKWLHNVIILNEKTYRLFNKSIGRIDSLDIYMTEVERKGSEIFTEYMRLVEEGELKREYDTDQQSVLRWMLTNIPTSGIWSTSDGNKRMNVLSDVMTDSVFYDCNMKYLLLERIAEKHSQNSGKRYVTLTWKGFEGIRIDEIPTSVCYIKRGYLAKRQKSNMLLPLIGHRISSLLDVYFEEDITLLIQIAKRCMGYFGFVSKVKEYADIICGKKEEYSLDDLYFEFEQFAGNKNLNEINGLSEKIRTAFVTGGEVEIHRLKMEREEQIEENGNLKYCFEQFIEEKKNGNADAVKKAVVLEEMDGVEKKYYQKETRSSEKKGCTDKAEQLEMREKKNGLLILYEKMPLEDEIIGRIIREYMAESTGEKQEKIMDGKTVKEVAIITLLVRHELFQIYKENLYQRPELIELKNSLWGTAMEKESMLKYVSQKGQEKLSVKEVAKCYDKLIDEMLEVLYIRKVQDEILKLEDVEMKKRVYRDGIEVL